MAGLDGAACERGCSIVWVLFCAERGWSGERRAEFPFRGTLSEVTERWSQRSRVGLVGIAEGGRGHPVGRSGSRRWTAPPAEFAPKRMTALVTPGHADDRGERELYEAPSCVPPVLRAATLRHPGAARS